MEHMKERWAVSGSQSEGQYVIESDNYAIARVYTGQNKDNTGIKTAQAICDEHNAALDRAKVVPNIPPPPAESEQPAKCDIQPQMSNTELQAAIDSAMRGYDGANDPLEARWAKHLDTLLTVQAIRAQMIKVDSPRSIV